MSLSFDVIKALAGKTLVTAESCTGGGIGSVLTAVPGSSQVYKGGVICYTDWVKENVLRVDGELLKACGAVSEPVAAAMASGARKLLQADIAVSATGLAGPDGDGSPNPVGTVFIGYDSVDKSVVRQFHFDGDRDTVRSSTVAAALELILQML